MRAAWILTLLGGGFLAGCTTPHDPPAKASGSSSRRPWCGASKRPRAWCAGRCGLCGWRMWAYNPPRTERRGRTRTATRSVSRDGGCHLGARADAWASGDTIGAGIESGRRSPDLSVFQHINKGVYLFLRWSLRR